jgi:hypothetical protein
MMRSIDLTIFAVIGLALVAAVPACAQQPPPQAPPKAYKPITVSAAAPMSDAGLDALRKQIGDIAGKKDKKALAGLVVAKGFFWDRADGKPSDGKKSGLDNLSAAIGLNEDAGWESLGAYAGDPTAAPSDAHKGAVCAPSPPKYDQKGLEALAKATGTDMFEWGFVSQPGSEIHAKADPKSPLVEKVDMILIRVYEDPNAQGEGGDFTRVVGPSGKVGFISSDVIRALMGDQLCYVKDGAAWKIGGYVGGGEGN